MKNLRAALKGEKKIELIFESPRGAYLQSILSRGDRRMGKAVALAAERGGIKSLIAAMREFDLNADFYAERQRGAEEILPWSVVDIGVAEEYLATELKRAEQGTATPPCFSACRRCGVCDEETI